MHEDEFRECLRRYIVARVDRLNHEAERGTEIQRERAQLASLIEKVQNAENADDLEFLINAVRASELPLERYCYHHGLLDGIQITRFLEDISRPR